MKLSTFALATALLFTSCSSYSTKDYSNEIRLSKLEVANFLEMFPLIMIPFESRTTLRDAQYFKGLLLNQNPSDNSVFKKVGLQKGDVLITINEIRIQKLQLMYDLAKKVKPGDQFDIEILRKGKLVLIPTRILLH